MEENKNEEMLEIFTSEQVYNRLLNVDSITSVEGKIRFFLGNVDIVVKQKDVVGNIIQEWLEGWLKKTIFIIHQTLIHKCHQIYS